MSSYDASTIAKLTWQYGPERAAQIVAGHDEPTNHDQALWSHIGGLAAEDPEIAREARRQRANRRPWAAAQAADKGRTIAARRAKIVKLFKLGVEVEHIAERLGLSPSAVSSDINVMIYGRRR